MAKKAKTMIEAEGTPSPGIGSDLPDPAVKNYYNVTSKAGRWELRCKHPRCKTGYVLNKPKPGESVHAGNLLALLNHAYSHRLSRE